MSRALLPMLFCIGGLLLAHHEMVVTGFASVQTDTGDTRFNNYMAEHEYRWLLRRAGHLEFWSPQFFFPARNVAGYSEVMLGATPLYWPWRVVGLAPDSAYQAWMLTLGAFNFAAMYVFLRRGFLQSSLGAAVGGIMFAFSAPRVNQLSHLQLIPHFWSLLCLYALLRLFAPTGRPPSDRQQRVWIWVFFMSAALQVLASFCLGWFLCLALTIAAVAAVLSSGGRRSVWTLARSHGFTLLAASAVAALVLMPLMRHFYAASHVVGLRTFENAREFMPALASWAYLGPSSWLYGWTSEWEWFQELPGEWEQRLGIGLLTTALALGGLWRARRDPRVRYFVLVGACLFVLSTSIWGLSLWRVVYEFFPAAKAVRGVSRVGMMLLIPIALGVSLMLTSLRAKGRRGLAVALGLLAIVEQGQTTEVFDKSANREDIADLVRHIDRARCASFVFSPVRGNELPWEKYQIDAMWAQLESGVPTLNGYSGNHPPGWTLEDTSLLSDEPDPARAAAIDEWVGRNGLDRSRVCWLRLGVRNEGYWATFVSQSVPRFMAAGEHYRVQVTLKNVGNVVWRRREQFRLGADAPQDTDRWGRNRVGLSGPIRPDENAVFSFEVIAPAEPGVYPFQWRMIQEAVRWFGEPTELVQVTVAAAPPAVPAAARDGFMDR